jgi:hypothetical protein
MTFENFDEVQSRRNCSAISLSSNEEFDKILEAGIDFEAIDVTGYGLKTLLEFSGRINLSISSATIDPLNTE